MKYATGIVQMVAGFALIASGVLTILIAEKKSRKGKW